MSRGVVVARRSAAADAVPEALRVYRPADWSSAAAWHAARSAYLAEHRPVSLVELNATWYGPGAVLAPRPDPREVCDGAVA
jgi:hypothetical protein